METKDFLLKYFHKQPQTGLCETTHSDWAVDTLGSLENTGPAFGRTYSFLDTCKLKTTFG